jgi:hypothetical protein
VSQFPYCMHAAVIYIGEILGMSLEITKYIINISCNEYFHFKHICSIFSLCPLLAFYTSSPKVWYKDILRNMSHQNVFGCGLNALCAFFCYVCIFLYSHRLPLIFTFFMLPLLTIIFISAYSECELKDVLGHQIINNKLSR